MQTQYRTPGFNCALKQLQMVLYKSDCDSNDYKVPSEQATPPTLARELWPVRLQEKVVVKISRFNESACVKELCVSG